MKIHNKRIVYTEIGLVAFVWMVLVLTPILFREDIYSPIMRSVIVQLEITIPLLVVFLINRFILVPKLLFKGKQTLFIVSVLGVILLFTFGSFIYDKMEVKSKPPSVLPSGNQIMSTPDNPMILPPYSLPGGNDPFGNLRPIQPHKQRPIPPFANLLILAILVVGFDTGLRSSLRWMETENEKVSLEKENIATQLVLLRNQVSPHFFMNTLNNIHALVDINTEEAKESIIKLSKMMRYLLYETQTEATTLTREVEFLHSYIDLMKLRYNEKVSITLTLPTTIPEKIMPPFLFTSLIENAFKHGVSYREESFINIDLMVSDDRLVLIIKNSKANKTHTDDFSGIGLDNTQKRLALLYGDTYHLDIIDADNIFTVNLSIPL